MRGWRGPYRRLRRADAAGRPPGAAATRFGREGYRSTPVTGIARKAHAGSTVAYACSLAGKPCSAPRQRRTTAGSFAKS